MLELPQRNLNCHNLPPFPPGRKCFYLHSFISAWGRHGFGLNSTTPETRISRVGLIRVY
jgi:hypothetical protein